MSATRSSAHDRSMNSIYLVTAASYDLTAGRALTLLAIPFGILGVVLGARALRAAKLSPASGCAGLVSTGLGVWTLLIADGGPGTGNGVVGAAIAVVLGLAGMALGGLAHLALIRREQSRTRTPA
jgi:hypothetical protein